MIWDFVGHWAFGFGVLLGELDELGLNELSSPHRFSAQSSHHRQFAELSRQIAGEYP